MLRAAPVALRFDRARFFDAIRPLFGSSLTVGQVEGMENLDHQFRNRRSGGVTISL